MPDLPATAAAAPPVVSARELDDLRAGVERHAAEQLADLERLVSLDCGSYTKAGVDEVGRWVTAFLEGLGASVVRHRHETFGDTIVGTIEGTGSDPTGSPGDGSTGSSGGSAPAAVGSRLLLIGHMDTVFDPGTAAARPFRIEDGIAYGPGVTDMKGGLLTGLYALRALRDAAATLPDGLPFERVTFVANPDEEIGRASCRERV